MQVRFAMDSAPTAAGWDQQLRLAVRDASAVLKPAFNRLRQAATVLVLGVLQRGDRQLQRTVLRLQLASTESQETFLAVVDTAVQGISMASGGRVKVRKPCRLERPVLGSVPLFSIPLLLHAAVAVLTHCCCLP